MSATLTVYVTGHGRVGHAYIGLTDSNGKTEYWGYYPDAAFAPDVQREGVEFLENGMERIYGPGRLANDEKTFENYDKVASVPITLSEEQYRALHEHIQDLRATDEPTDATYSFVGNNCVDFVNDALKVAGHPGDIGDLFTPEQLQDTNLAGLYLEAKYGDHHINPSGEVPSGDGIYNRTEWATGIPDHPSADGANATAHDETKNADPAASPSAPDVTVDHASQPEPQIEEKAPNQEPLPPESLTTDPQEPVGEVENIVPPQETGTTGGSDAPAGYDGAKIDLIQNQYGVPSGVIVDPADEPIVEKPDFVESNFTVKDPEVMIAQARTAIDQSGANNTADDVIPRTNQIPNVETTIPDPSEVWNNQITGNVIEPSANEPQGNGVVSTPDTETSAQAASTTEPSTSWAAQISGNVAEPGTDQPQSSSWVDMVSQNPPTAEPPPPAPDTWAHTVAPPPPADEASHSPDNTQRSWVDSVSHDSGATHDHGSSSGSHGSSPDV